MDLPEPENAPPSAPLFIENLFLSSLDMQLTLHASIGVFLGIHQTPLYFAPISQSHVQLDGNFVSDSIVKKYITDAIYNTPSLIGNSQISMKIIIRRLG
jgi:hypothetical protein